MKEALRKLGSCFWKLDALTTKEGGFTSLFFFFCFCLPVLPFLRLSAKSRRSACAARAWTRPSNFEGEENEERVCQSESHDRSVSLECQRNSSGSPLQAPCESFLQGQENIQQLQHFRGVIPELFSFHRPQAEEDFQKTSRLSLPASLQRSSDSSSPSCCRREPIVIRSLSPLLQASPPIESHIQAFASRDANNCDSDPQWEHFIQLGHLVSKVEKPGAPGDRDFGRSGDVGRLDPKRPVGIDFAGRRQEYAAETKLQQALL